MPEAPVILLDQTQLLSARLDLHIAPDFGGTLHLSDRALDLREIAALYVRPYETRRLRAVTAAGPDSALWQQAIALDAAIAAWVELTPALVLNRFSAMASNASKPYQLHCIRQQGFRVPATLITTDPEAARQFWHEHGEVIYKSASSTRSRVARLRPEHQSRLDTLRWCPTQFQQYVPGTDYRVHVIGDDLFASAIRDDRHDDYRYGAPEITACTLPAAIADRCHALARRLALPVAGIDLRQTPDDAWYCFEVNPSPGFTFYQAATGQPIAAAVAHLLTRTRRDGQTGDRWSGSRAKH